MAEEVTVQETEATPPDTLTDTPIRRSDPESIFTIAPFALLETDSAGRVFAASAAAERMMQIPPGSLRGRRLHEFVPPEEKALFGQYLAHGLEDAAGAVWCTQLLPGLGGRLYVRLTVTASRGDGRLRWLIEDLTPSRVALLQEKRLAKERQARSRAESAAARFELLAETAVRLAGEAGAEQSLRRFAECLLPELADICEVDLADANGGAGRPVFVGRDPNGNPAASGAGPTRNVPSGRLAHSMTASLASGGRMFGALTVGRLPSRAAFEDDDFTMLRAMGAQLAARLSAESANARGSRGVGSRRGGRHEIIERRIGDDRRDGGDRRTTRATLA
jgi:hypothetical protein